MTATEAPPDELVVHILWLNAGLSCDGDSVALTAATQPAIEEIALGAHPEPGLDAYHHQVERVRQLAPDLLGPVVRRLVQDDVRQVEAEIARAEGDGHSGAGFPMQRRRKAPRNTRKHTVFVTA